MCAACIRRTGSHGGTLAVRATDQSSRPVSATPLAVDSTIARAHQHATNITRHTGTGLNCTNPHLEPPDHTVGRSRGGLSTKIHQLVDGHGLPLVAPGQSGDSPAFPYLLAHLQVPTAGGGRPTPARIESGARKAYSSRVHRDLLRRRGIGAVNAKPDDPAGHRRRRGSRGGRPPAFDRDDYRGRNVVERRFCYLKQSRGLATRYDELAIVYRAAVVLNAVIAWTQNLSDMPSRISLVMEDSQPVQILTF
ncbi:transposase [Rhodococcus jostii]|uniref:transposase n=1 Tax=Rhodococcus jostii TaxID=132919 RepID=UPI0011D03757